jgi:hypothetical protein
VAAKIPTAEEIDAKIAEQAKAAPGAGAAMSPTKAPGLLSATEIIAKFEAAKTSGELDAAYKSAPIDESRSDLGKSSRAALDEKYLALREALITAEEPFAMKRAPTKKYRVLNRLSGIWFDKERRAPVYCAKDTVVDWTDEERKIATEQGAQLVLLESDPLTLTAMSLYETARLVSIQRGQPMLPWEAAPTDHQAKYLDQARKLLGDASKED